MKPGTRITISKGQFEGMEGIVQYPEIEKKQTKSWNKRTGKITGKFQHEEEKIWVWVKGMNLRILTSV